MNKITVVVVSAIASALLIAPVFAQNSSLFRPVISQLPIVSPGPAVGQPDAVCMKAAIEKRDSSLITAFDARAAQYHAALVTRKDAMKAAWDLSDPQARNKALRAAWNAYKLSVRDARHAWAKDRDAAWKQYKADASKCRGSTDSQYRILDSAL